MTAVPITVASTTDDYFVLWVRFGTGVSASELPVAVVRGQSGTTTLAENVEALPAARYRVEKYAVSNPADVDGDCIDDLTELDAPATMSPVNAAVPEFTDGNALTSADGAVHIADRTAFETLAKLQNGVHVIKFVILGYETDEPALYFMNTNRHQYHYGFSQNVDSQSRSRLNGDVIYDPSLTAPDGSSGAYYLALAGYYSEGPETEFGVVERAFTQVAANMPFLRDNLAFYISNGLLPAFQDDLAALKASRMDVLFTEDIYGREGFAALNLGVSFGYLRRAAPDARPSPRDIVVYETLPNDAPRVAGIISTVAQTPLSHVNLRAIQDGAPNAYIRDIFDDASVEPLIGRPVAYTVSRYSHALRAATVAEVDAYHADLRPSKTQTPERDLSVTAITPLCKVGFGDWDAFGVKAANVAELGHLGFGAGTVPDGFAIPFYFYDEFMKANSLYTRVDEMLALENFLTDLDKQEAELKKLRKAIKDADTPAWIITELTKMHNAFGPMTSLRYRSSTNNEDLPGFNGAGLYDSKTQKPDETRDDGLSKSLKQVYASLWNFRAFAEREFYRIDHKAAAMGVLVHPNYSDELANGVGVSFDPFDTTNPEYGSGPHYLNTQVGEDLVTNPEAHSVPEEILLSSTGAYRVIALSNQVERGELLLSDAQLTQLRGHLDTIHDRFEERYGVSANAQFAMEIEFKITADDVLAIKQARPWVFADPADYSSSQQDTSAPTDACASPRVLALGSDTPIVIPPERTHVRNIQVGGSGGPSGAGGGGGGGGDFDVGVATFVVANGWSPPDVGIASVLAARTDGAVVTYTAGGELSAETATLMREALPAEVVIVGGIAAVSRDVRTQIRFASDGSGTVRVTGADRADTAATAARRILGDPSAAGRVTLVVANGWSPPDIGAAAALAARSGRSAVLYTRRGSLGESSAAVLRDYDTARVILIGGTAAISNDVQDQIADAASSATVSRLVGVDRIDTAAQAARRVLGSPAGAPDGITLVIANGWSPPDVGVAAALAAATDNAAVAYTQPHSLPQATAALIRDYRPAQIIIIGGRAAVHNDVRTAIAGTAPDEAEIRRITGQTRTDTAARVARRVMSD